MRPLKIAFLLNPIRGWDFEGDTSLSIMTECHRRNHAIYFLESKDLVLDREKLYARLARCHPDERRGLALQPERIVRLETLDALIVRKDPPFNADYLHCTHLLDFLQGKVFLLNDPQGIRNANEKISSLVSPFVPKTRVSHAEDLLVSFVATLKPMGAVLKPLDQKGGIGVVRTDARDPWLHKKIRTLTRNGSVPILAQEFIPHEHTGDKRILLLEGKPIGVFTRIPSKKDFRANMSCGGQARRSRIESRDFDIIRSLVPFLKRHGLYFVGIDVLDGRLTEINVTSPAGIPEINELENVHLEETLVDFIERAARQGKAPT